MGLSAPRKRTKISHDPNNTHWSRSTSKYGHKLLISQGWQPGQNLGAINAPHASLHTDASASHIRIALREDNLGLGAKIGSGQEPGRNTGLDAFQTLLGRLNGKSNEMLEREQKSRDDLNMRLYAERRWGGSRFVSGGLLVGNEIKSLAGSPKETTTASPLSTQLETDSRQCGSEELPGNDQLAEKKDVRRKRKRARQSEPETRKGPSGSRTSDIEDHAEASAAVNGANEDGWGKKTAKAKRKEERAQRKLERQQRRETRRAEKLAAGTAGNTNHDRQEEAVGVLVREGADSSKPGAGGGPTVHGRQAVRSRYIQQKKMAVLDAKSLNEILMIKA